MDPQLCNHLMEDDDENKENARHRNASAEVAGVVRGVSRSVARSIVKPIAKNIPKQVPKMTKQLFTRRGQLRVKGVAKVSDRLSTGWDVYSSVKESVGEGDAPKTKKSWAPVFQSLRTFTATLLRNSIVGAAVFETYVYTISKAAGDPEETAVATKDDSKDTTRDDDWMKDDDDDDDDDDTEEPFDAPDAFSRASILTHVGAGALAGSLDGLLSSVWEFKSWQKARQAVLQQSISHALLFGSYECCKRNLIHRMHQMLGERNDSGLAHLGCIGVAGGVAGQLQTLTNHYGEQMQETRIRRLNSAQRLPTNLRLLTRQVKHPPVRSIMNSFVPSAVGFVAFEYGKRLGS